MDTASINRCNPPTNESDIICGSSRNHHQDASKNAGSKTLRAFKKDQKMSGQGNAESGFVSYSSSDSNVNDEANGTHLDVSSRRVSENDYVNFASGKSFLKVELKSAIYSRGYLSIWVKITYRIYEKISDTDWIGLYYAGKFDIHVRLVGVGR